MLIIQVNLQLLHLWLKKVELPTLRIRTCGADILDFRVLFLQNIKEFLQTLCEDRIVFVVPLLVTNTHEFQIEWCWVSHISTYLSPLGVNGSVGKLYEVKTVVDVWLQLIHWHMGSFLLPVLVLASQSDTQNRQGFCTNVLTELEELKEPKSV